MAAGRLLSQPQCEELEHDLILALLQNYNGTSSREEVEAFRTGLQLSDGITLFTPVCTILPHAAQFWANLYLTQFFHRHTGGIVNALIELGSLQVTSFNSIKDLVSFIEPHMPQHELESLDLGGYDHSPTSLAEIFEIFLAGHGLPLPISISLPINFQELASEFGEDLNDAGARSRLFLQAATGSPSLLSDTHPSVRINSLSNLSILN